MFAIVLEHEAEHLLDLDHVIIEISSQEPGQAFV